MRVLIGAHRRWPIRSASRPPHAPCRSGSPGFPTAQFGTAESNRTILPTSAYPGNNAPRMPAMEITEKRTRSRQVDIQLARAGWTVGNRTLVEEFLLRDPRVVQEFGGYL